MMWKFSCTIWQILIIKFSDQQVVVDSHISPVDVMIHFILLFSRQGKLRLQKWYDAKDTKDKKKIIRELTGMILQRKPKMCNFIEYKDMCIVYKRYASLFFCFAVDKGDNELGTLEVIHRYVEVLDKYFGSVCELDIIFNFEKAYFILDELLLGGEMQVLCVITIFVLYFDLLSRRPVRKQF